MKRKSHFHGNHGEPSAAERIAALKANQQGVVKHWDEIPPADQDGIIKILSMHIARQRSVRETSLDVWRADLAEVGLDERMPFPALRPAVCQIALLIELALRQDEAQGSTDSLDGEAPMIQAHLLRDEANGIYQTILTMAHGASQPEQLDDLRERGGRLGVLLLELLFNTGAIPAPRDMDARGRDVSAPQPPLTLLFPAENAPD